MTTLQTFIDRVLSKRHLLKPKLELALKLLQTFEGQLAQLRNLSDNASTNAKHPQDLKCMASDLSKKIEGLTDKLEQARKQTLHLMKRFGKKTIAIGMAGRPRQGKSTILHGITGLNDTVIPTSDGMPCTGAKSRIVHQASDPHGEVEFLLESEYMNEIIHSYYTDLGINNKPRSLEDFCTHPTVKSDYLEPSKHGLFGKLKDIHARMAEIKPYLSHPIKRIPLDEVIDYVTQTNGRMRYQTVRCVNVFTPFPNIEATGLAVIDLPGLGELALGHEEKLVSSLEHEIDAIIVVKRPDSKGDDWSNDDYRVFNIIKMANKKLELKDWLFVFLNETVDGNGNQKIIAELMARRPDVGSTIEIIKINGLDQGQVRNEGFIKVLNHLENNLERMDQLQLDFLKDQLSGMISVTNEMLVPIKQYFGKIEESGAESIKFERILNHFLVDLQTNLSNLAVHSLEQIDTGFTLKNAVSDACEQAVKEAPFPTQEDLRREFMRHDKAWLGVVQYYLPLLRSALTRTLATSLDGKFQAVYQNAQNQLINSLIASPIGQILDEDKRNSLDPSTKIQLFIQILDPKKQNTIYGTMDYLMRFSYSYHSHMHHRIRAILGDLKGDSPSIMDIIGDPSNESRAKNDSKEHCEQIRNGLEATFKSVLYKLKNESSGPNRDDFDQAIKAMYEEFEDRLGRTKDIKYEWYDLLYPHRSILWPDEFDSFAMVATTRRDWLASIGALDNTVAAMGQPFTAMALSKN